jgi:serine/threonine-protein kinase SRPK3
VLGNLGYGANSTVWLCRDTQHASVVSVILCRIALADFFAREGRYVTLKLYIKTPTQTINRELLAYQHLKSLRFTHAGHEHIRELLDSFEIVRPNGNRHHCLVHSPLHITLWDLQRLGGKSTVLPEDMVRSALPYLLQALDFLHTEANITHCGT